MMNGVCYLKKKKNILVTYTKIPALAAHDYSYTQRPSDLNSEGFIYF